jgi:transcriptional regulator with XRE-family HTH domain
MIDPQRTGAYISSLRKARDWTQQQLAEKLLVTHQAVSQWEKGVTFPDIALLPPLANLLGVSVDALLHGQPAGAPRPVSGGAMVEEFARGNPAEVARMVRQDPEGIDHMLEAAPLVRPSQMNEVVGNLAGVEFTLAQVLDLAPFVSEEALQSLLERAGTDQIEQAMLARLAPFLSTEALDQMVERAGPGSVALPLLKQLAPFLSQAMLTKLLAPLLESGQKFEPDLIDNLAPFIEQQTLDDLLEHLPEAELRMEFVVAMAPFASQEALERLIGRLGGTAQFGEHLLELAPFLSSAALKQAIAQSGRSLTAQDVVKLAPFLDRETLEALFRQGVRA